MALQVLISASNSSTSTESTDIAAIPLADYSFLGIDVKRIGPGVGYMLNYPANVDGAPPSTGGQFHCVKYNYYSNVLCTHVYTYAIMHEYSMMLVCLHPIYMHTYMVPCTLHHGGHLDMLLNIAVYNVRIYQVVQRAWDHACMQQRMYRFVVLNKCE